MQLPGTGARRSAVTPDVPTLQESGLAGFDASSWNGIFVRAGTPTAIIEKLNRESNVALSQASIKARLIEIGLEASASTATEVHDRLKVDIERWKEVITKVGVERQ